MACGCSDSCSCVVQGANGNIVTGAGTVDNPFVVTAPDATPALLTFTTISGMGNLIDPDNLFSVYLMDEGAEAILPDPALAIGKEIIFTGLVSGGNGTFQGNIYGVPGATGWALYGGYLRFASDGTTWYNIGY